MPKFIEETFGGAKRKFRLGIGELRELQDATGIGPAALVARFVCMPEGRSFPKRPEPKDYTDGEADQDYIGALQQYAWLRSFGGDWRIDDLRSTLKLGLVGGGASDADAEVLMMKYVDRNGDHGLHRYIGLAASIVIHGIASDADDPVGKAEAEIAPTATPATES